jgi:hypothetical protein
MVQDIIILTLMVDIMDITDIMVDMEEDDFKQDEY